MEYHYTWEFARYCEPLLGWLHRAGFFNFYIHLPAATALGMALFAWVFVRVRRSGYPSSQNRFLRFFWHAIYFSLCWVATSSFGVGLKTMIVEELDYQERRWFEPYLAPSHLYISSAALVFLAFIVKTKPGYYDLLLALYAQVALLAGYAVAGYRVLYEDMEGATGGVLLLWFFAVCNYDLIRRVRRILSENIPAQSRAPA